MAGVHDDGTLSRRRIDGLNGNTLTIDPRDIPHPKWSLTSGIKFAECSDATSHRLARSEVKEHSGINLLTLPSPSCIPNTLFHCSDALTPQRGKILHFSRKCSKICLFLSWCWSFRQLRKWTRRQTGQLWLSSRNDSERREPSHATGSESEHSQRRTKMIRPERCWFLGQPAPDRFFQGPNCPFHLPICFAVSNSNSVVNNP